MVSHKTWRRWLVPLLLIWVTGCGLFLAWHESMTTDEGIHTASAYLALTRGDQRFDPEHPFLFKYLTALPLLPLHLNAPADDQKLWASSRVTFYDAWQEARTWSDKWFYQSGNNAQVMIFLARIPAVLCLVALCWVIFVLTKSWFGEPVALWALFFTAFNPTLLAHGATTNTDVPLALAYLLCAAAFWRYSKQPSRSRALWVGLSLGIALTTKFSAIAIPPAYILWLVYLYFSRHTQVPHLGRRLVGDFLVSCGIAWLVIWTVYGWRSPLYLNGPITHSSSLIMQAFLRAHGINMISLARVLFHILPSAWWKGAFLSLSAGAFGRPTYLLNHVYPLGVWYYFPILFLLKTQLIALLILVIGIIAAWRQLLRPRTWQMPTILLTCLGGVFLILSLKSKLNIGIRHITPLLALFSIMLAGFTYRLVSPSRWRWYLTGGIVVFYALPVFWQMSNLIGFGNLFVHPYQQAYLYYHDSNLDWGQQSQQVAQIVTTRYPDEAFYINYPWNPYALRYFGADPRSFDPKHLPASGIIAATATQLAIDPNYAQFRQQKADYVLDNTTFFYRAPLR